jgi:hypothetical protein
MPPLPNVTGVEIRPIPEFPGYAIGDDGTVWGCRHAWGFHNCWHCLVPYWYGRHNKVKYLVVGLRATGAKKRKRTLVHILVLSVFRGPKPTGQETRHLDGHPDNNRLSNLVWGTSLDNTADKIKHGHDYFKPGQDHPQAKLTTEAVLAIRSDSQANYNELALKYGVSPSLISLVKKRRAWKHLP